jgi:hypothetical protein
MLEYAKLFVDLLKAIAWPVALFAIVYMFRAQLRELLPRVRKAGPTGVEIAEQELLKVTRWSGELKRLPVPRTNLVEAAEKALHEDLQKWPDLERVDLLVNRLAVARISAFFERVYGAIFGSQIRGLKALVASDGKVSIADARKFFEEEKLKTPQLAEAKVEFEGWIRYLVNFELVRIENDQVIITDAGRDFTTYLPAVGLNENKLL